MLLKPRNLISILVLITLAACSSTKSFNKISVPEGQTYSSFLIKDSTTGPVNEHLRTVFAETLRDELEKRGYKLGEDLIINFNFLSFDPGNRALRYFVGFGQGQAKSHIITTLVDKDGTNLGTIDTQASMSMGFFGGSDDEPIHNTVRDVVREIEKLGILQKTKS